MGDYSRQQKHLVDKYTQLRVNVRNEILDDFKEICYSSGSNPSKVIKDFIDSYIKEKQS